MARRSAAYVTARVRGMKSHLLSDSDFDALLSCPDTSAIVQQLLSSPYEEELAESLTRYEGVDAVEDAVTRNLVHTFTRLRRACTGDYAVLADIFIARWDLAAVKSLLRNRHHGLDASTGAGTLYPSPTMPVALMTELAGQDTMDALVRGLVAWNSDLCRPLAKSLGGYNESKNLRVLEEALDRGYFVGSVRRLEDMKSDDAGFLRELLRFEIDRINLRRVFEPRPAGVEVEDVLATLLPEGALRSSTLREMAAAGSPERAAEFLTGTAYREVADALPGLSSGLGFGQIERRFEQAFLQKLKRAAQQQSMGLAVLLRFAWMKYNEVINIRMIVRGRAVHLPADRIREELVYV
jgi:V/A-type H+/Na+-transporting ATPase subunit C